MAGPRAKKLSKRDLPLGNHPLNEHLGPNILYIQIVFPGTRKTTFSLTSQVIDLLTSQEFTGGNPKTQVNLACAFDFSTLEESR